MSIKVLPLYLYVFLAPKTSDFVPYTSPSLSSLYTIFINQGSYSYRNKQKKNKMGKNNLEKMARKAVPSIEKKVRDINNVMRDLSMKLCHVIRYRKDYYTPTEDNHYYK